VILLDTNVPIYAGDRDSAHWAWARATIADAVDVPAEAPLATAAA